MQAFEYARPKSLAAALGLLGSAWGETEILAGGTDLLSLMKNYVVTPKRVVDIKGLELGSAGQDARGGFTIRATTTFDQLLQDKTIHDQFNALAQAAAGVSSPQIRNMGTAGGDLCQRPRCWYYRNGFGLLALDKAGKSLVPGGENKYHAILGNEGPAYFVNPSSLAPALIALGAKVRMTGPQGTREVALSDFFVIPKSETEREHAIRPDEILTEIVIPDTSKGLRSATYEVRQKEALDWPLATASVALKMKGSNVESATIVLGHIAPIPWQAKEASAWLAGKTLSEDSAAKAGEAAVRGAKPLSQNAYKVQLARVAVKRALVAAMRKGV
ncbi:MAG TPA: FAD binding domain-containing protein [Candidatus Dormibacteraeota bacterium]|nr:FAD binding domain-containing protein [Candidatus Dormibacteraeota bacterium]